MPVSPGPARTARLLLQLVDQVRVHMLECAASFELSPPQAMALRALETPLNMGDLAGILHCDASNVTGIIDRLETRGLAERRPQPGDRRVKQIALTAEGERLRAGLGRVMHDAIPGMGALSEEEAMQLEGLLLKVMARADEERS
jgi:DNA-binding MarR family transcriptional regulator